MAERSASRRRLGVVSLAAVVVGNMVGAGVFTTSGFALADLGSPGRVLAAWGVGAIVAVAGALCYGALAVRLRESGGEYLFLSRTLHPGVGFVAGWVSLWAGFTGAIAFAAETAQSYLSPWLPRPLQGDPCGSLLILGAGALHAARLAAGTLVQNVLVAVKLIALLALVAFGAWHLPDLAPPAALPPWSWGAFAVTLTWVSLSYSGWNAAVYVAGEARALDRALPRAMLGATLLVSALYLALNAVFVAAAPAPDLAVPDIAAAAAGALGGAPAAAAVRAVVALACTTSIFSMVMAGPRVYARMADDGVFPRWLRFRGEVPRAAVWLQVGLSVAVLWASGLRAQLSNLGWILSLGTVLAVIGLCVLRRREGPVAVPIPGYPWVPLGFVAATLGAAVGMVLVQAAAVLPAVAVLGSGVLVYAWFARRAAPAGGVTDRSRSS